MKKIIITRLWDRFIFLVTKYMQENDMNQTELAKYVDIYRSHFNALLHKKGRVLSAFYLSKFITRGIIKVNEIYDGAPESEREEKYWISVKLIENRQSLLLKIDKLDKKGVDIEDIIDRMYPNL